MIFTIKNTIRVGLTNLRVFFKKILKLPTFRMLLSRLFHSATAEGKNEFLKKLYFVLKRGVFSISSGVRGMP